MNNKSIKIIISSILIGGCFFVGGYILGQNFDITFENDESTNNIAYEYNVNPKSLWSIMNTFFYINKPELSNGDKLTKEIYQSILNSELYRTNSIVKENIDAWGNKDFSNIENFYQYLLDELYIDDIEIIDINTENIELYKNLDLSL